MKSKTSLFLIVFVFIVLSLNAYEKGPIAISPGRDVGIAVVEEICPTFSWTAVEWASGYRITVFEAVSAEVMSYEQMAATTYPVLDKEIEGRALSWTPSSDEHLSNGGMYVWYVQAIDAYGTAKWSEGRIYRVEVMDKLQRIGEKLSETLKSYGLNDEVISDVLKELDSELGDVNSGEAASQGSGYRTQDKIGIQGNEIGTNTWYGELAGISLTTGSKNTFMGQYAGRRNTTGVSNTFIGQNTGLNTIQGYYNTFVGQEAGRDNTAGYRNTFIGRWAGHENTQGNHNTFIGQDAGYNNQTGWSNICIGASAGHNNQIGTGNIFFGYQAGFFETGSNKLYIDNSATNSPLIYGEFDNDIVAINGKFGVGIKSPEALLEIVNPSGRSDLVLNRNDGATFAFEAKLNNVRFGSLTAHSLKLLAAGDPKVTINTDGSLEMSSGATCTAAGVWTDASSRAFKENIQDLTAVEAKHALLTLNPVKYNYKEDKEEEYLGFIAEDVPELVASKDRKGMSPMDVVAVLTKVVQEQQDMITELQERIAKLEEKPQ